MLQSSIEVDPIQSEVYVSTKIKFQVNKKETICQSTKESVVHRIILLLNSKGH